jgi:hypothetical protein
LSKKEIEDNYKKISTELEEKIQTKELKKYFL